MIGQTSAFAKQQPQKCSTNAQLLPMDIANSYESYHPDDQKPKTKTEITKELKESGGFWKTRVNEGIQNFILMK